jgi:poly(U)-specific endoribonuclease
MAGDIYQEIWDADQEHAGIRAVRGKETADGGGYVIVDEKAAASSEHKLLPEIHIPDPKLESYRRVAALFNNYTLDQTKRENDTPEERAEVQAFLEAIHRTPPMEVARDYAARQTGRAIGYDEWWAIVERVWFERSSMGGNVDLSGFEHTMVGEQKQGKLGGYHFWYKYYLDENFVRAPGAPAEDLIDFKVWKHGTEDTPDVVTLSYVWRAFDYESGQYRKLTKPTGGFWVGPSAEGLLAMGTVRFLGEMNAPREAVINGHRYKLSVHAGGNPRNLRSFYPEYVGVVDPAGADDEFPEALATAAAGGASRILPPAPSVLGRSRLYEVNEATGEVTPFR